MLSASFILYMFMCTAFARVVARSMQVHEALDVAPAGFIRNGPASPETMLNLRLALVPSDMPGLHKALYDVSTPSSPNYGQYLTKAEVDKFSAPKPESVNAVHAWLAQHNITATAMSTAGEWMKFSISVSKARELLDADFDVFTHIESGESSIRTLAYSLPSDLKDHVELVHPTTSFWSPAAQVRTLVSLPKTEASTAVVPASCAPPIRPQCILDLYGVPNGTLAKNRSNMIAVTSYGGDNANQADLRTFLTNFRSDMPTNTTFTTQLLDNGSNSQTLSAASGEGNLDTQYTIGVATGVPVVFIAVGTSTTSGSTALDTANFLLNEAKPPQVVTTSYSRPENSLSLSLANNICNAYAQLGAMGTSVIFSSGDGGVGGETSEGCTTFMPTFPNGCPFVTSVGATNGVNPETAATLSAGGFSNYFARPSYQDSAVKAYLAAQGSTYAGLYNATGRAFPDVSAQGRDFEFVKSGVNSFTSGTSASAPVFASIVALLNDALMSKGKPPLGFLNPFLYSTGAAGLTDITSGNNPGCGTNGFSARVRWDPVTGLGTPNYGKLKAILGV